MNLVIFDLDLTLVDSSIAEGARSRRDWQLVYSLIPQFSLYPGIGEVFQNIRANQHRIKVAIVSTAPTSYIKRVVHFFNIPVDTIVGYHDATRKPSPAGMNLAMKTMDVLPSNTVSFGDSPIDIQASNSAGIRSVACAWGTKDLQALCKANPSHLIFSVSDMMPLI